MVEAEICTLVARNEGITGSELAESLGVTRSATSQLIAKLTDKGCILQKHDDGNRKRKRLYVTKQGRMAAKGVDDYYDEMAAHLYKTPKQELQAYLRFVENLEAFLDESRRSASVQVEDRIGGATKE